VQARKDELRLLKVQPVAENMWLKRSLSDSSLTEVSQSSFDVFVFLVESCLVLGHLEV